MFGESMTKKDFYFELSQRNREYSRGEYFSTLDVIDQLEGQNTTLQEIRKTTVDFYRNAMPEAFAGLDRLAKETAGHTDLLSEAVSLLGKQSNTLNSIEDQIFSLRNSLDMGFERLISRIDRSNEFLSTMVDILSNQIATQAGEFARRANKSLQNGWYEEALKDLNRVLDLDPLNYVAWYYFGVVNIEQLSAKAAAREAFSSSQKYAKPESGFYYSSAMFQLALIDYSEGLVAEALSKATLAFKADNRNTPAAFLLAELHSHANQLDESLKYLSVCEKADVIYFFKSSESKALKKSGIHEKDYGAALLALCEFNKTSSTRLSGAFKATRRLVDEFKGVATSCDIEDIFNFSQGLVKERDYVACRIGHDKLFALIESWTNCFDPVRVAVQNYLQTMSARIRDVAVIKEREFVGGDLSWKILVPIGVVVYVGVIAVFSATLGQGLGQDDSIGSLMIGYVFAIPLGFIVPILISRYETNSKRSGVESFNLKLRESRQGAIKDISILAFAKREIFSTCLSTIQKIYSRNLYTFEQAAQ